MKVYNIKDLTCFESKLNEIASNLNIKLDYNLVSKNCMRVKLVKTKENKSYQRKGYYNNKNGTPRKVNAICWHGFKDFLTNLFDQYPKLRVVTAQITYNGYDEFMSKFESTAIINIGSQVQPLNYEDACFCS